MKAMRPFILLCAVLLIAACTLTKSANLYTDQKIQTPKLIAIAGVDSSWVYELEKYLTKAGFTFKPLPTQDYNIARDALLDARGPGAPRYLLWVDGAVRPGSISVCTNGGFSFDKIEATLVEVASNTTIAHYTGSGYSENCYPLFGTIFTDIANLVSSAWQPAPAPAAPK